MAKGSTKWRALFMRFIKNLRIQSKHASEDPDGTGIELRLWTSQSMVLDEICDGLENGIHQFYILKSRQLGVTTITLAILLFWLALHPNTVGCMVSDDEKNCAKNRQTIRKYIESLRPFMGKEFNLNKSEGAVDNKFGFTFSNGSRLDMLVAGTKVAWGEGEGYIVGHLTEVSKYRKEEGIESFRHSMAPDNPRALYIFESTAHGPNHWKSMWESARQDEFSSRCIFVGWWANNLQRIKMSDRRFLAFGTMPPTPEENEKVIAVKQLYGFDIDMEQLAWYRWQQTMPNSNDTDMDQNQPWTEEDAFIQSGVSFFQQRLIKRRIDELDALPECVVEEGGNAYFAYNFYLADEYHMSNIEQVLWDIPPDQIKLRVWEKPKPGASYVIGVDPAGGRSEDSNNHCANVWRCFADKLVQVAEWADSVPETRHVAWVTAYLAGQYQNCRINIDLTGGVGSAVMQAFDDLRERMRSDMYKDQVAKYAEAERQKKEAENPDRPPRTHNGGPQFIDFDDFLGASSWYLYRRIDSPGPGYVYNTKLGYDLKRQMMNVLRDSWVTNLLEIRSKYLLQEMQTVVQTRHDIGASAPGKQRDDRTFAMALANWSWSRELRGGLISQGVTWEGSKQREAGVVSPVADTLNRMVYRLFKQADEAMDAPPPRSFLEERGLG